MGLSDGAFFTIKHIPLPNGNHSILSPICPMGVADTYVGALYQACDLYDTSLLQFREPRLNITPIFLDCLPLTHSHSAGRTQGAPSVPCTTNNDDQIAPIFINPLPLSLQLLSKYSTTDFISWGYLIYEYHMVPDFIADCTCYVQFYAM